MAKTILLADDSVTIQKVVELTFMDEDYRVVATGDGASALEQIPELGPDLVIADVHMPGADGYEVCRQTKATHPSIPVLLLVGTFEHFDEQKAVEVGADGHLKKPFDSQDLLSQVETLIARSEKPAAAVAPAVADAPPAEPDVFELDDSPSPIGDLEPPPLEMPGESAAPPAAPPEVDFFGSPMPDLDATPPPEPMAPDVMETATIEPSAFDPPAFDPPAFEPPAIEPSAFEPPAVALEAPTHQVPTIAPAIDAVEDLEAPLLETPAIDDFESASAAPFAAPAPDAEPFAAPAPDVASEEATWASVPAVAGAQVDTPAVDESFEAVPAAEPAAGAPEIEEPETVTAEAVVAEPDALSVAGASEAEEQVETAAPAAAVEAPAAEVSANGSGPLSEDDIERIAKRVAELVGEKALRDIAWEVLPDLAEVIIKERIRELESQVV